MEKAGRIVLWLALVLLAAGIVLIGAAWLTGTSPDRIVELVFNGPEGLQAWLRDAGETARRAWDSGIAYLKQIF